MTTQVQEADKNVIRDLQRQLAQENKRADVSAHTPLLPACLLRRAGACRFTAAWKISHPSGGARARARRDHPARLAPISSQSQEAAERARAAEQRARAAILQQVRGQRAVGGCCWLASAVLPYAGGSRPAGLWCS